MNRHSTPKYLLRFFRWFCHPDYAEDIEGDLHEKYERYVTQHQKRKADWLFLLMVLSLLRPELIKPFNIFHTLIPNLMLRNNLKIAWRNITKNKGFSAINIGGLALGMMVAILIGLWVYNEVSFNSQYENSERIAQFMQNQTFNGGEIETWRGQAMQLEPALRNSHADKFDYIVTSAGTDDYLLSFEDKEVTKEGGYFSADVMGMLSLEMVHGTRDALKDMNVVVLSASTAEALFGTSDPMGKLLKIGKNIEVTVSGVYKDLPKNSSFGDLTFIAPFKLLVKVADFESRVGWGNSWFRAYCQITEGATMEQVSEAIKKIKYDNIDSEYAQQNKPEIFLHPMNQWYLYNSFENGKNAGGRIEYVWLFGTIGLFVLILACINFMNLSTARSEKRAKEVGIRKTLGSMRAQIIGQFYSESLLVTLLAFVVALFLAQLFLPTFNQMAGEEMTLLWRQPLFWVVSLGFILLTGLLAGSYPSLYLSSFRPVKVLKGTFRAGKLATLPRKVLVVTQFTVSVSLIIGTLFVFKQIQHAKNRPINYNRDNIVRIPIKSKDAIIPHLAALRTDLLTVNGIEEVVATDSPITSSNVTNGGFTWEGKDPNTSNNFTTLRVTYEFGDMVDWELVAGRDFSRDFATDSSAFVINEAAVEYMGLENPIGTIMRGGEHEHRIVGVVKNMITQSPYEPVRQMLFMLHEKRFHNFINIKLNPKSNAQETLAQVETVYKKYDPENDFVYRFEDETFARKFRSEERIGKLAAFFAILAIIISCLGLFGLTTYIAEQRTKEIGIRKVLGASILNLWQLLSKEFVLLVTISCCLAVPFAYYFTNDWLANYTYRTDVSWWVFMVVAVAALAITLLTVSVQALRTSLMNPVKAIKNE